MRRNAITEASASNMSAPKAVSSVSGKIQVCQNVHVLYVVLMLQVSSNRIGKVGFLGHQQGPPKWVFGCLSWLADHLQLEIWNWKDTLVHL